MQIIKIWIFTDFLNKNLKPEIIKGLTGKRSFLLSDSQAEEYFKACLEEAKRNGSIELKGSVTKSGKPESIGVELYDKEYYEDEDFYYCVEIYSFYKGNKKNEME